VDHPLDVLVYATGFETTGWHWSLEIAGRDGAVLNDAWKRGPEAYLGITVSQALLEIERRGLHAMEPSREAQDRFNREIQEALAQRTWADPSCSSWYKTADGKITQNWSSHTRDYAAATKAVNFDDYLVRHASC
jgi:hypothetical protein